MSTWCQKREAVAKMHHAHGAANKSIANTSGYEVKEEPTAQTVIDKAE